MDGSNIILLTVTIVVVVTLMLSPSGGIGSYTDYDPTVNSGADDIVDDINDTNIETSDPTSALASALTLVPKMISVGLNLPTIAQNLGVPIFVVRAFSVMVSLGIGYLIIDILLRVKGMSG